MSKAFDQDAPETQLGFKKAQEKAESLHTELLSEIDAPGASGDIAGAEQRLDDHLTNYRPLLESQERWSRDYAMLDNEQILKPKERDSGLGL